MAGGGGGGGGGARPGGEGLEYRAGGESPGIEYWESLYWDDGEKWRGERFGRGGVGGLYIESKKLFIGSGSGRPGFFINPVCSFCTFFGNSGYLIFFLSYSSRSFLCTSGLLS